MEATNGFIKIRSTIPRQSLTFFVYVGYLSVNLNKFAHILPLFNGHFRAVLTWIKDPNCLTANICIQHHYHVLPLQGLISATCCCKKMKIKRCFQDNLKIKILLVFVKKGERPNCLETFCCHEVQNYIFLLKTFEMFFMFYWEQNLRFFFTFHGDFLETQQLKHRSPSPPGGWLQ